MRALVVREFGPVDSAGVAELDDPAPAPGEVVVDIEASDMNYPDLLYIEGRYQRKPALPFAPGLGGVGRITACGKGAKRWAIGRRVLVLPYQGTLAEKIAVPERFCFDVPEAMPPEVGACLGLVYQTAWFALKERAAFRTGETVLVVGASGGVGMAAVQLARALGAACVIAATRGEESVAFVRRLGADVAIDTTGFADPSRDLRDAVRSATGGEGVDIVVDPVGGDTGTAAVRAMAWSGRLVVVGFAAGTIPTYAANYLLVKNITVSGLQWTDYRERQPDKVSRAQRAIFKLWSEGRLEPVIDEVLPLDRVVEGLKRLARGQVRGKLIMSTRQP